MKNSMEWFLERLRLTDRKEVEEELQEKAGENALMITARFWWKKGREDSIIIVL